MQIKYLIVHCTATREGLSFTAADVDRWHRAKGWNGIGYHFLVRLDGTVETGRSEHTPGAHCAGLNNISLGICYVGGLASDGHTPKDTRTPAQIAALRTLLTKLKKKYPHARIVSHHHFNPHKACPSFDADTEYSDIK